MFTEVSEPISKEELREIESQLGIKFPDSFTNHYLKYNGGLPEKPVFYDDTSDLSVEIQLFAPIKYAKFSGVSNVEERYVFFKSKADIMRDYLPFANDYGGNQICLNLQNGKVYMIYMDMGELTNKQIKLMADGIDELLAGLTEDDIDYD